MKSIKEKQLLVKWARAMNEPIDDTLVEEVERYERTFKELVESVKQNSISDLAVAAKSIPTLQPVAAIEYPKPPTLEEVLESVKEIEKPVKHEKPKTLAERAAEHIHKEVKIEEQSYQQPDAELSGRTIKDIRKKIKFLEDWIGKISLTGPGGGAGDIINLDMPTTLVTGDYTITRRDYYVGVNSSVKVNITLPSPSTITNGREVIIKDESGHAQLTPIKVIGTVDNDPNGFEIRINNGSVTLLYRNGWRIV